MSDKFAKVDVKIPKDGIHLSFRTEITVDGKPLQVNKIQLTVGDGDQGLVIRLPKGSFTLGFLDENENKN